MSRTVRRPLHPLAKLLDVLVAHHLGGAAPNDSIAGAMARGLGYDGPQSFRTALLAESRSTASEDLNTRWRDAMGRLFSLKGTTPDCDGPTFAVAVEALFSELPERLQHHPFLAACGPAVETA